MITQARLLPTWASSKYNVLPHKSVFFDLLQMYWNHPFGAKVSQRNVLQGLLDERIYEKMNVMIEINWPRTISIGFERVLLSVKNQIGVGSFFSQVLNQPPVICQYE